MRTKKCTQCGERKPLKQFYFSKSKKSNKRKYSSICKKCAIKNAQEKRRTNNSVVANIKHQKKCAICGEDNPIMLDFHHVEPDKKFMEVSKMLSDGYPLKQIKAEIRKCVVLCANHHRYFHHLEHTINMTLEDYLEGDYE